MSLPGIQTKGKHRQGVQEYNGMAILFLLPLGSVGFIFSAACWASTEVQFKNLLPQRRVRYWIKLGRLLSRTQFVFHMKLCFCFRDDAVSGSQASNLSHHW